MLDKYQKAEIDEFYDGTYASVKQLAVIMKINPCKIRYYVDEKYRAYLKDYARKWQKCNPERAKEITKKASAKYLQTHREKISLQHAIWKQNNAEKYKESHRKSSLRYYRKNTKKLNLIHSLRYYKRKVLPLMCLCIN